MMKIDVEKIERAIRVLAGDGNICELRALGVDRRKRTDAGYFDNFKTAAEAILPYANDPATKGCYIVLNQICPDLLARSKNQMQRFAELTTSDRDVARRRWLYVDCDPVRPAGISSTNGEAKAACQRAEDIHAWLMERGCYEPITAMSGNGAHLLVPIDLPNTDESLDLVKRVLEVLDDEFSDTEVNIDTSVCNAARICRLYGTPARKGSDTKERPHRVSVLQWVPDYLLSTHERTPASVLESIAALKATLTSPPVKQAVTGQSGAIERSLIFPAYLQHHGIEYREAKGKHGVIYQIDCPFNPDHKRPDAYVGQIGTGATVFHCSHDSCRQHGWRGFRELIGNPEPSHWDPPLSPQTKRAPAPKPAPKPAAKPVDVRTLKEAAMEYASTINEPQQQLLQLGLGDLDASLGGGVAPGEMILMAARPSHGKSLVALQVVHTMTASGVPCCFMSEEMSAMSLGKRTAQYATATTEEEWRGNPTQFEQELRVHFHNRAECYVVESSRTVENVCDRIRQLHDSKGVQVAVIDYAQLLDGKGGTRYEKVTNTSISLRHLATETGVTLIVLCQMSRAIEGRQSFTPQMGDLKESGQLEQDADVLCFLVWPYMLDQQRDRSDYKIFVQKNRNRGIAHPLVSCQIHPDRQRVGASSAWEAVANSFS